jgi:deoxyribose-phosphate aldolase
VTPSEVASKVDLAVLNPAASYDMILAGAELAIEYQVASFCVNPTWVSTAAHRLSGSGIGVCAVVDFPHGSSRAEMKASQTIFVLNEGATEVDMVMNLGKFASGFMAPVRFDMEAVCKLTQAKNVPLKVIIESSVWNPTEIRIACDLVIRSGAQYVKTSTGFTGTASVEDVKTIIDAVGDKILVKASGGIKTFEQAVTYLELGCARLGLSDIEGVLRTAP